MSHEKSADLSRLAANGEKEEAKTNSQGDDDDLGAAVIDNDCYPLDMTESFEN